MLRANDLAYAIPVVRSQESCGEMTASRGRTTTPLLSSQILPLPILQHPLPFPAPLALIITLPNVTDTNTTIWPTPCPIFPRHGPLIDY